MATLHQVLTASGSAPRSRSTAATPLDRGVTVSAPRISSAPGRPRVRSMPWVEIPTQAQRAAAATRPIRQVRCRVPVIGAGRRRRGGGGCAGRWRWGARSGRGHEGMLPGGQQCHHGDADAGGDVRGLLAVDALRDLAQRSQADAGVGDREVQTLPESADLQARRGVEGVGGDECTERGRGGDLGVAGAAERAVVVLRPADRQQFRIGAEERRRVREVDPRDQVGDDGGAEDQRKGHGDDPDGAQARVTTGQSERVGVPDDERVRLARGSARRSAGSTAC